MSSRRRGMQVLAIAGAVAALAAARGCRCGSHGGGSTDSGTDAAVPGDAAPGTDATTGADAGGGVGTDGGPPPCGPDPAPPGASSCPAVCTGGCTPDNVCVIDCPAGACNDTMLTCPAGYDCRVVCNGLDACDTTTIQCPATYRCTVQCDVYDSCGDVNLLCTDGWCDMQCGANGPPCGGAVVSCGTGACTASCGTADTLTVNCGAACTCVPCP